MTYEFATLPTPRLLDDTRHRPENRTILQVTRTGARLRSRKISANIRGTALSTTAAQVALYPTWRKCLATYLSRLTHKESARHRVATYRSECAPICLAAPPGT